MQKCPVPLVPPNCKWDNLTATRGCKERHAAPRAPHTSNSERASRKRKSLKLGGTQATKQLAQSRPTHSSETSLNTTHNNTQGNHEVRALQQPQMRRTPSEPSATPPPPLYKVPTYSTRAGAVPCAPGGARHRGGKRAVTSQLCTGQSTSYGDVKSSYRGAGGWDRKGCATGAPRSANRHGEEQHRHTERGGHTRRDKGEHSRQGGGAQQGKRGHQNSRNREPAWSGWESMRMGGRDNKGDGLASQPRRYRVLGQPLLNWHQLRWGVSPTAQMGCLRNRSGSPSGADQL